jgi:hypothetical protein
MPFAYHLLFDGHVVHFRGTGASSPVDEARSATALFTDDPGLKTPYGLLVDVRAAERVPTAEEARDLANLYGPSDKRESCAALLVQPGVHYGVARMMEAFAAYRGRQVAVFTDEERAVEWLLGQVVPSHGTRAAAEA